METVHVSLGQRSYAIRIESGLLNHAGNLISELPLQKKATIITNETIAPLYLTTLKKSLERCSFTVHEIIIPDGEQYKGLSIIEKMYTDLLSFTIDRNCPVIALGGGVVGDMTGFAASTILRGVPYIQIPTTLLSQVDSSVGGKTGVNLPEGKNLVGSFYQPSLVIIDPDVLKTLDPRELRAGLAEVIKYGIIRDETFFSFLEKHIVNILNLDNKSLIHTIKTCCGIKADITSADETEKGVRSLLNFGHTIGHAIETLTNYKSFKHGEAVSMGMAAAALLSHKADFCSREDYERIVGLLQKTGLPTDFPVFSLHEYGSVIGKDKKRSAEMIRMVLMQRIGSALLREIGIKELSQELVQVYNLS